MRYIMFYHRIIYFFDIKIEYVYSIENNNYNKMLNNNKHSNKYNNTLYDNIINCDSLDKLLEIGEINKYAAIEIYSINRIVKRKHKIVLTLLKKIVKDKIYTIDVLHRDINSYSYCISRVIKELVSLNITNVDNKLIRLYMTCYDYEMENNDSKKNYKYILYEAFRYIIPILLSRIDDERLIDEIVDDINIEEILPIYSYNNKLITKKNVLLPTLKHDIPTIINMIENGLYFGPNNFAPNILSVDVLYTYKLYPNYANDINDINKYIDVLRENIINRNLYLVFNNRLVFYNKFNDRHPVILEHLLTKIRDKITPKDLSKYFIEYRNIRLSVFTMLSIMPYETDFKLDKLLDKRTEDINYSEFLYLQNDEFKYEYIKSNIFNIYSLEKLVRLIDNIEIIKKLWEELHLSRSFTNSGKRLTNMSENCDKFHIIKGLLFLRALEMDNFTDYIDYFNDNYKNKFLMGNLLYGDIIVNNIKEFMKKKYTKNITIIYYYRYFSSNYEMNIYEEVLKQRLELLIFQYNNKNNKKNLAGRIKYYTSKIEQYRTKIRIHDNKLEKLLIECDKILKFHDPL